MKIKIGNKIYDSEQEAIMIILNDKDKQNISNMLEEHTKYCCFPEGADEEKIEEFMKVEDE